MGEYVERIGSLGDVHKEESDHDKQGLSRRSFLKVIGGGTAAGAVSYLGAKALVKAGEPFLKSENFPENIASLPHLAERAEVARNMEAQLDEIRKYREELGLTELPRELAELENNFIENFVSVELWKKPAEVKVEMPAISRSYGEVIKDVMEKMYGDKSGRLVNKVYNDEQNPFGIFFRGKGREVSISWTITDIPLYPNFIDFSLHDILHRYYSNLKKGNGKPCPEHYLLRGSFSTIRGIMCILYLRKTWEKLMPENLLIRKRYQPMAKD